MPASRPGGKPRHHQLVRDCASRVGVGDAALVLPSPVFGIPGFAGRAERTARNTLENCLLFAVLALTAHVSGATPPLVLLGAQVFVVSRLVFIAVYYLGMMVRGMF